MSYPPPFSPGDQAVELPLAALSMSVPLARQHTRLQLRQWHLDEHIDVLQLAVSEIVTNSLKATGALIGSETSVESAKGHPAPVRLRLRLTTCAVYAEVWDKAEDLPAPAAPEDLDEGGRGLGLVAAFCDDWGYYPAKAGGKVTWCGIKVPPPPCGQFEGTADPPLGDPGAQAAAKSGETEPSQFAGSSGQSANPGHFAPRNRALEGVAS